MTSDGTSRETYKRETYDGTSNGHLIGHLMGHPMGHLMGHLMRNQERNLMKYLMNDVLIGKEGYTGNNKMSICQADKNNCMLMCNYKLEPWCTTIRQSREVCCCRSIQLLGIVVKSNIE